MASRNKVYASEQSGTPINMPKTPIALPPTVTANNTHSAGRPTEVPTTRG